MTESPNRQFRRVDISVEVSLSSDNNFYTGQSRNLSEGGIFVVIDPPLPRNTPVGIRLHLAGSSSSYDIEGLVRWSSEHPRGCGIQFVGLPTDALAAIQSFTRKRDTIFVPGDSE